MTRRGIRAGMVGASLLLAASALALAEVPAQATTASVTGTRVETVAACTTSTGTRAPFYRRDPTPQVSPSLADSVARRLGSAAARRSARALPTTIVVPIRAHVVKGSRRGDRHTTRAQVIAQVKHLNQAYDGMEAPGLAADTHVRFRLRSITATTNDRWYHISGPGRTANQMKRALHQGSSFTLNLYFVDLAGNGLLGYTTFPWREHVRPLLDGVVVAYDTVPGGTLRPYNEGDTAVHEIGHWLGLLHTFQGGCKGSGDGVSDTPAEAEPQYRCDTTSDTCSSPGLDPVHNFMDYSLDSCMNQFTSGQAHRMLTAWAMFRERR